MQHFIFVKLTDVKVYQTKYIVYAFFCNHILNKQVTGEKKVFFYPFSMEIFTLRGHKFMLETYKHIAEADFFYLQFDIVMVQNSFHLI